MRRVLPALVLAVLVLPAPAVASLEDVERARAGLAASVKANRLTPAEAGRYRTILNRAHARSRRLAPLRAQTLEAVVGQVAQHAGRYTGPRALTLFTTLEANSDYLVAKPVPPAGTDVEGPDGIVYRAFSGLGLQFHPLANAARLNGHVSAGRAAEADRLVASLLERRVARSGGDVWEYWFPFGSVRPPWASGMAQAVLAQALARAGSVAAALRAARTVPGLTIDLRAGPWVRLYQGLGLVVLNAQLQSAISLAEAGELAGDVETTDLAMRLRAAATAMLPSFDTGYWSQYSQNSESTLAYQRYVVTLLRRLARETGEPHWAEAADRFEEYERQAPLVKAGPPGPVLFPVPQDGHRDTARIRFWVSKICDVTLFVGGKWRGTMRARMGWNTFRWQVPKGTPPGSLAARISARGLAGNLAETELPEVVVMRDAEPPQVRAAAGQTHLHWRASDEGSDRLRLSLRLKGGGKARKVELGRRALNGSWRMRLPEGRWWGVLEARDASSNLTRVPLGRVA